MSWGWVCGAAALVVLATLTPQQGPSAGADFFVPLIPERVGQWRDIIQNIVLYLPLGLLLGVRGMSASKVVLGSAAVSLAIELAQFVVPGRDPIARDVITNALGGALGWLLAHTHFGTFVDMLLGAAERLLVGLRAPSRRSAAYLSLVWAVVVLVTANVTYWLISPDLPPPLFFGVASSSIDRSRGPVNIGGTGSGARGFNGLVDEVRIYTRARSGEEVASDMNRAVERDSPGADLVAAYGFDSSPTSPINDASGTKRRIISRETTWVPNGRLGGALSFNGSTSQVVVSDAAFDLSRGLTLEAWVFPVQSLNEDALVIADASEVFFLRATSYQSSLPLSGMKFGGVPRMVGPRRSLPLRAWTHLATTYDGRFLRMYVNGQLASEFAHWSTHQPSHVTLNGSALPFGIMRDPQRLPAILLGDFSLDITVTCGELVDQPAVFFLIGGIQSINALELLAAGPEVRVRFPQKAQRLGLASVDQRIGGALTGCTAGPNRRVLVQGPLHRARLLDAVGSELRGIRPGVGSTWSFFLDSQLLPLGLVVLVSACYLAALAFPFGLWARGLVPTVVAVVTLLATTFLVPLLWDQETAGVREQLALTAGVVLGLFASWRLRQRTD
jgi:VanZ family protein